MPAAACCLGKGETTAWLRVIEYTVPILGGILGRASETAVGVVVVGGPSGNARLTPGPCPAMLDAFENRRPPGMPRSAGRAARSYHPDLLARAGSQDVEKPIMHNRNLPATVLTAAVAVSAMALSGTAFAYNEKDAIRDCNKRMRAEYGLTDFRHERAEQLMDSEHHYKVTGKSKVDGEQYPYDCEIKKRHVTAINYDGKKPEGLGTAETLAIGAAAAIGTAIAVDAMTKDKDKAETLADEAPAAPEPQVRTLAGRRMEVEVSTDCRVEYNDIGMRDGHSDACTAEQLTAANKAVTKHLSAARANAQ